MNRTATLSLAVLATAAACVDQPSPVGPARLADIHTPQFAIIVSAVTELPALSTGSAFPFAINNAGQTVGTAVLSGVLNYPVLWEQGAIQILGTLSGGGGLVGTAAGINDLGAVVGQGEDGLGNTRPFLWAPGAGMQDLGTLGGSNGGANDINNSGHIVGFAELANGENRAFLLQNGVMQDLGTLGTSSFANAVNELGEVAGSSRLASGVSHAFFWRNGVMQDLGIIPNQTASVAMGLNDLGEVVGRSGPPSPGAAQRAFHWQNGVMRDLGHLGFNDAEANDINDLGQIVGVSGVTSNSSNAFLYMDGVMYNLGAPFGVGSSGIAINNVGQVAGRGVNANGELRAFVWNVPIRPPVDLLPGDATNTVRWRDRSTLTVAILTNKYFSAATVDAATVTLGDEAGTDTPVARKKKGVLAATSEDVDRDGDADLVLQFDARAMSSNGDLKTATTKLILYGRRFDGRYIRAVEAITVVP